VWFNSGERVVPKEIESVARHDKLKSLLQNPGKCHALAAWYSRLQLQTAVNRLLRCHVLAAWSLTGVTGDEQILDKT
jgi:hypothetical protein